MPFIDDDATDGSSFVWSIQNFSYCSHKPTEYLDSPSFFLDTNEVDRWNIRLYPRGVDDNNFSDFKAIGLLLRLGNNSTLSRTVEFALSIRTTTGVFKKVMNSKLKFSRCDVAGHRYFMERKELLGKEGNIYLDNDTMTLKCRIWKVDDKLLPYLQCCMRTIINVERTWNIWSLEKFRQNVSADEINTKLPMWLQMQSLISLKLFLYRNSLYRGRINLEIKQINEKNPCFVVCDISLLETGGKVFNSTREEHRFDAYEGLQVWTFPYFLPTKILDYEKTNLRCELSVSSGIEYKWVERVENSKIENILPNRFNLNSEHDFADSRKDDLKRLYSDGKFTDVIIRTSSKDFPVHKAILCARSAVFYAMFERDMKENGTGVVNIEDMDADTVHKMLLFAYSDVVEDLDCNVASKLYFAADKYRITALRRRCSDFLKASLSVSNVCEVSVLADMHKDEDLKSFAQDFIVKHAAEVMFTVKWKRFMRDHVHLASEMMHVLLLLKLKI